MLLMLLYVHCSVFANFFSISVYLYLCLFLSSLKATISFRNICMCKYLYMYICVWTFVYKMYTFLIMHVYECIYMSMCVYIDVYVCVGVCIYIHIF